MAVLKYLDLSTGHISEDNANLILETEGNILGEFGSYSDISIYGYPYEYGTFLRLGEITDDELVGIERYFPEFGKIITYCVNNEINMICFDKDAEVVNDFETFEW